MSDSPWIDFVASIDDSHPMTTDRRHIAALCEIVQAKRWRILELGSHAGISAAAMAMAAPESTVVSVDLCDTVPEAARVAYWASLGLKNVHPVAASAADYIREAGEFDLVFHDAVHGPAAFAEYMACAAIAQRLAIHDFEQLPNGMRSEVTGKFSETTEDADARGRVLFVGHR